MCSPAAVEPAIPLSRLTTFVRNLTHDIRNGLNAIDLESAFIAEIVTEPEAAEEVKRLRGMVNNVTKSLQQLSDYFAVPTLNSIRIEAAEFLTSFRERLTEGFKEKVGDLEWRCELRGEAVEIDFESLSSALMQIFRNAFQFREDAAPIVFRASAKNGEVLFSIIETKTEVSFATEQWGREPLISTRRGGYGLGLFHARRIVEAHGGRMEAEHKNGQLVTSVTLPQVTA